MIVQIRCSRDCQGAQRRIRGPRSNNAGASISLARMGKKAHASRHPFISGAPTLRSRSAQGKPIMPGLLDLRAHFVVHRHAHRAVQLQGRKPSTNPLASLQWLGSS